MMWLIIVICGIALIAIGLEYPVFSICVFAAIVLFFIIRAIYRNSPAGKEKARQQEESTIYIIQSKLKKSFNVDFTVSFHIDTSFAIDKSRNLIYTTYYENTISYFAYFGPSNILNYSLSPHYETLGNLPPRHNGRYELDLSFRADGKIHRSNIIFPSLESGREVIQYLDQVTRK